MSKSFIVRVFTGMDRSIDARDHKDRPPQVVQDGKLWNGTLRNFPCPQVETACVPTLRADWWRCNCPTSGSGWQETDGCDRALLCLDGYLYHGTEVDLCQQNLPYPLDIDAPPAPTDVSQDTCDNGTDYASYRVARAFPYGVYSAVSAATSPRGWCGNTTLTLPAVSPGQIGWMIQRYQTGYTTGEEERVQNKGEWLVIDVVPVAATSYLDTVESQEGTPADPDLEIRTNPENPSWLVKTESGVYACLDGDEVWFTLPGDPASWSYRRRRRVDRDWGTPRALVAQGDDLYVLTDDLPVWYELTSSEAGWQLARKVYEGVHAPLTAPRAIAKAKVGVIYPTTDGVMILSRNNSARLGSDLLELDDWQATVLENSVAAMSANAYILSTLVDCLVFEFGDNLFERNPLSAFYTLSFDGKIVNADLMRAQGVELHWVKDGVQYIWNRDQAEARSLRSREFPAPTLPVCPFFYRSAIFDTQHTITATAARIDFASAYYAAAKPDIWFRLYQMEDNLPKLLDEHHVTDGTTFRIPALHRSEDFFFELEGYGAIDSVTFATSRAALRSSDIGK